MKILKADLSPTPRDVLYLLVIGEPRLSIHGLYLSARTVNQRIAEIKRILGASERFCFRVRSIRGRTIKIYFGQALSALIPEDLALVQELGNFTRDAFRFQQPRHSRYGRL